MTDAPAMPRAGVIGWPVGHSLSPVMHRHWLARYGLPGSYDAIPVTPEDLPATFDRVRSGELRGFNVTLPHKVAALDLVDHVTARARQAGSVNTVFRRTDGSLEGDSTDGIGFLGSVADAAPGFRPADAPACLLGAGGAARSIGAALLAAGTPELRIVNRTAARAADLQALLGPRVRLFDWSQAGAACDGAGLLANTTSLGMRGQPPLDGALLRALLDGTQDTVLIVDIVYTPLETELVQAARARGRAATGGLDMLLHQGRPGFEAWFGVLPAVTPALRTEMEAELLRRA